jgi:hypothetical protein
MSPHGSGGSGKTVSSVADWSKEVGTPWNPDLGLREQPVGVALEANFVFRGENRFFDGGLRVCGRWSRRSIGVSLLTSTERP